MGNAYPFNLQERNTFTLSMDEENMVIKRNGNSTTITATFHNESCRTYTNDISLNTYILQDNKYKLQKQNAVVRGNIEPFGEQRLTFTLDGLNSNIVYSAYFFYHPDDTSTWKEISGPHLINYQQRILLGDANGDREVNITDVFVIVDYILGRTNNAFNFVNSDLDKDGTVTLSDALSVVDIILGRSQSSTPSDSD